MVDEQKEAVQGGSLNIETSRRIQAPALCCQTLTSLFSHSQPQRIAFDIHSPPRTPTRPPYLLLSLRESLLKAPGYGKEG